MGLTFSSSSLQDIAKLNTESLAELLINFFQYFAVVFDYRKNVVSVKPSNSFGNTKKQPQAAVTKLDKAENSAWSMHDRLR